VFSSTVNKQTLTIQAIQNQCCNCECIIHLNLPVAMLLPTHSTNINKEFTAELEKKKNTTFILHATS